LNNPSPPALRIGSIDLIRGAAMILMAIDHVRVYSGIPAGGPTPEVFFTRWLPLLHNSNRLIIIC
jgi:uncharacterized membrane protein